MRRLVVDLKAFAYTATGITLMLAACGALLVWAALIANADPDEDVADPIQTSSSSSQYEEN